MANPDGKCRKEKDAQQMHSLERDLSECDTVAPRYNAVAGMQVFGPRYMRGEL